MKRSRLILFVVIYLIFFGFLCYEKTKPYEHSLSSLIGIWEGFYEINPDKTETGFVVYKSGGYDGQFFYFIAKDLFAEDKWELIVDSFYFRLHRIGLSILTGLVSSVLGFDHYPIVCLTICNLVFLSSFFCLVDLLPNQFKYLSILYLFSPFSLNANLLLVADSLFVSFGIIGYYFFKKNNHLSSALLFFLMIFTRELGILFLIPITILKLHERSYKIAFFYFLPILLFLVFLGYGFILSPNHLGTNPLGFRDMTDYPLFGFFKSFFESGNFHFSIKEFPKIIFLLSFILVSLGICFGIKTYLRSSPILILPILGSLGVILIAEEGYWRSFDNLSRMFTLVLPITILLFSETKSLIFKMFFTFTVFLIFFIFIRTVWITPSREFFLAQ
ncbi:hypothetical protein P3G55_10460 [Leptospira sp. 96542]|nr:hypothetical protein [Leptospira sp. 96542]